MDSSRLGRLALFDCFVLAFVCGYTSGQCLPRDDVVMDQEFFKSLKWESRVVLNGTKIERVALEFTWEKQTSIDYSGVMYEVIVDRGPPPYLHNTKTNITEEEEKACKNVDDYRTTKLTTEEFELFCTPACVRWCDGTFCSDVFGQDQLENKNARSWTVEAAKWGVEYYLRLEGYYNFSVSIHTLSESPAALFCLHELIEKNQLEISLAKEICNGTEYSGTIYRIGPPSNLVIASREYNYVERTSTVTFSWDDPYDVADGAEIGWFLYDNQYPPTCDEEGYSKVYATGGHYSVRVNYTFRSSDIFYVVACCNSCQEEQATGFHAEVPVEIPNVDTCKGDYSDAYCDNNAKCVSTTNGTLCSCYQGYDGDGIRRNKKYGGSGCRITCENRNARNHTCTANAACKNDEEGNAVCSCQGFYFGDGYRLHKGCTSAGYILGPILFVIGIIILVLCARSYRRRRAEKRKHMSKFVEKIGIGNKNGIRDSLVDTGLFGQWEMDRNDVTLHGKRHLPSLASKAYRLTAYIIFTGVLGRGVSGVVHKATFFQNNQEMTVAVKTVPEGHAETMFLGEISLITTIGSHENVLGAIGCCTSGYPLLLVTEYMQYGDLLHFLWDAREPTKAEADPIYKLCEADVYKIGRQVASGMGHLSHLKIIHGDLAARNVLVGKDLHCKISDFGLANDVYRYGMIQGAIEKKVPYKWISPERMMGGKVPITWRSDVWSCGVLLYEAVTLGGEPYPGIKQDELFKKLSSGYRMERPSSCGLDLYKIMSRCWERTPSKRPSFKDLESLLIPPKDTHTYINMLGENDVTSKLIEDGAQDMGTRIDVD